VLAPRAAASEASLMELAELNAGTSTTAAARGGVGSAVGDGITAFADLEGEMFTEDAGAAADEALQNVYGRVGPLGEDRSSPHFRSQAPKLRAESMDSSSVAANTFAQSKGRLTVSRYEYIGGYYGAGSESLMIRELQNGPVVVAFNSPGVRLIPLAHCSVHHHVTLISPLLLLRPFRRHTLHV
jgi:hypothetical protein